MFNVVCLRTLGQMAVMVEKRKLWWTQQLLMICPEPVEEESTVAAMISPVLRMVETATMTGTVKES